MYLVIINKYISWFCTSFEIFIDYHIFCTISTGLVGGGEDNIDESNMVKAEVEVENEEEGDEEAAQVASLFQVT